jgi:hypothetical protein
MSQKLELPDEVYNALEKVAQQEGMSPGEWVAAQLPGYPSARAGYSLTEALEDVIGVIDSTTKAPPNYGQSAYGDALSAKFEKQGLRKP